MFIFRSINVLLIYIKKLANLVIEEQYARIGNLG